jgi:hypothetical protein
MGFKNKKYFTIGQNIFWILIILLISFLFFHLADRMFDGSGITEELVFQETKLDPDTSIINHEKDTSALKNDSINFVWHWKDYNEIDRSITFKLSKSDLIKSEYNRKTINPQYSMDPFSAFPSVYTSMYLNDKNYLKSLINSYKIAIKSAGISDYQEGLNFVVSSIQNIGYTYVCSGESNSRCGLDSPKEDCRPPRPGFFSDDMGCCDNVIPLAVYAPFEFAYQRTGDCDTKALFAYTILKELGFNNVAVLIGYTEGGGHSMLGVKVPNPPYNDHFVISNDGAKYYAWEVTQGSNKLGQQCWGSWNNWRISIN